MQGWRWTKHENKVEVIQHKRRLYNLIQEAYPTSVHNTIKCVEQMQGTLTALQVTIVFFCVVIFTLFLCFFHLHPYMQRFFTEKLFTLVSFIFFVPQAKTIVMNGKTMGQFNTAALVVNYIHFFRGASCMLPRG